MLPIFLGFLYVGIAYLTLVFIARVIANLQEEETRDLQIVLLILSFLRSFFVSFIDLVSEFASVKFLVYTAIPVGIFVVFSFMPYLNNLNDAAYIFEQEKNIELYERYTEEYSESARQQIEEFQRMQSEMAARASAQQLQVWSLQQDEVGDALTQRIEQFQTNIREAELEMNRREARIEARSSNKWYFYLDE